MFLHFYENITPNGKTKLKVHKVRIFHLFESSHYFFPQKQPMFYISQLFCPEFYANLHTYLLFSPALTK